MRTNSVKRCPFCFGISVVEDENNGAHTLELSGNALCVWRGDEAITGFHIKYCPMCGTKLYKDDIERTGGNA